MNGKGGRSEGAVSGRRRIPLFCKLVRGTRRAIGLIIVAAALTGCISEQKEIEIGNSMAAAINPQLPLIDDPLLNAYVYSIGLKLGAASDRPDLTYNFYIVDSPVVNAFAIPGGHIYLTRGLIDATTTGEEFAAAIAHEIGHVSARHGIQKLQRYLRTGALVNVLYETILGGEPDLLRENSLQLASVIWSARYSRRDEQEADRLAVEYLARSGVDPEAVVSLLEALRLQEQKETGGKLQNVDWFSTHPLTGPRIEAARKHIAAVQVQDGPISTEDVDAFPAFKLLLAFRAGTLGVQPATETIGW